MKLVKNLRLVCISSQYQLWAKGHRIYYTCDINEKPIFLGDLPVRIDKKLLSNSSLCRRALRINARTGLFVNDEEALIVAFCNIYIVNIPKKEIIKEHSFRNGMKYPLGLCKVENLQGFKDGVLYGEYFDNADREEVRIYRRTNSGWIPVFAFKPGRIRHIHNIIVHEYRQSIIVFSGDNNTEVGIFEFKDDFKEMVTLAEGSQMYRSCVAFPYMNGLIYATDTPLENNSIYELELNKKNTKASKILDISGPVIYGIKMKNGCYAFATSVEPNPDIKGILSNELGPGVKNRFSYIYAGMTKDSIRIVAKAEKDMLPMRVFEFGSFLFPSGIEDELLVVGQGVKRYSNKTLHILL